MSSQRKEKEVKIKANEKKDNYLDLAGEQKKVEQNEGNGDTNRCWKSCYIPEEVGKDT